MQLFNKNIAVCGIEPVANRPLLNAHMANNHDSLYVKYGH